MLAANYLAYIVPTKKKILFTDATILSRFNLISIKGKHAANKLKCFFVIFLN